ncbi:MAG: cupin domain-containing protein [Methyloceanibacter sp.]
MGLRNWIVAGVLLVGVTGAGLVLAREPESQGTVTSQQLFVEPLAGDDSKEVIAQTYIFPPGAVLPWHIHPDAQEFAYVIEGDFTFERADRAARQMKAGGAEYLPPNIVHRGMNKGDKPVKLFVLRIKPKDKPPVLEVPAPH